MFREEDYRKLYLSFKLKILGGSESVDSTRQSRKLLALVNSGC